MTIWGKMGALATCLVAMSVQAQQCGDTLSSNTVLQNPLHCSGVPFALRLDTPGIELDLNGYEIQNDGIGILVDHADGAHVFNGAVNGAGCVIALPGDPAGIAVEGADGVVIEQIWMAEHAVAVALHGSSNSEVREITLKYAGIGFLVHDDAANGLRAEGNLISKNQMRGDPNCGGVGAWIGGTNATHNTLYANEFLGTTDGIYVGASKNRLQGNHHKGQGPNMVNGSYIGFGIVLETANDNYVTSNWIENTSVGVHIDPGSAYPSRGSQGNWIVANDLQSGHIGVAVGHPPPTASGATSPLDRIGDNRFVGPKTGIRFFHGGDDNNAVGNSYQQVGMDVIDQGSGNQWP